MKRSYNFICSENSILSKFSIAPFQLVRIVHVFLLYLSRKTNNALICIYYDLSILRFIKFPCCSHSFEIKGSIEWNCFEKEFKGITTFFLFRIKMKPFISKASYFAQSSVTNHDITYRTI